MLFREPFGTIEQNDIGRAFAAEFNRNLGPERDRPSRKRGDEAASAIDATPDRTSRIQTTFPSVVVKIAGIAFGRRRTAPVRSATRPPPCPAGPQPGSKHRCTFDNTLHDRRSHITAHQDLNFIPSSAPSRGLGDRQVMMDRACLP